MGSGLDSGQLAAVNFFIMEVDMSTSVRVEAVAAKLSNVKT